MSAKPYRPGLVAAIAGALTFGSITATAGFLLGKYELLPAGLPVSYRNGRPDMFIDKSLAVVLMPLWTQLILAVVIGSVCVLLLSRAHSTVVADEQAAQDRDRMLHGAEAMSLLGLIWISFQLINAYGLTELWLNWGGGMGLAYNIGLPTAVILSILIGARAMLKIGRPASTHAADAGKWRMKAFYFNPADPALFVPARYGYGLTLNFGRPIAIAIMLAILIVGLGGPFLLARSILR
jgi:uncharacterized membrane protein